MDTTVLNEVAGTGNFYDDCVPEDGELEATGILITQDSDEDLSDHSLEALEGVLEQAHVDAQASLVRSEVVAEAIQNAGKMTEREAFWLINKNQYIRQSRGKPYGYRQNIHVSEALTERNLVLALEEEAEEEKGFFRKIIDKIVNAFKWIWDKLAGLFGGGDKAEKVKKAAEATTQQAQNTQTTAQSASQEAVQTVARTGYQDMDLATFFAQIGPKVTCDDIEEYGFKVLDHMRLGRTMSERTATIFKSFSEFCRVIKHHEDTQTGGSVTIASLDSLTKQIDDIVKQCTEREATDDEARAILKDLPAEFAPKTAHVIEKMMRDSKIVIYRTTDKKYHTKHQPIEAQLANNNPAKSEIFYATQHFEKVKELVSKIAAYAAEDSKLTVSNAEKCKRMSEEIRSALQNRMDLSKKDMEEFQKHAEIVMSSAMVLSRVAVMLFEQAGVYIIAFHKYLRESEKKIKEEVSGKGEQK